MKQQFGSRTASNAVHTIASADDRARAFRKARRHSYVIRILKVALPAMAMVGVGLYGAAVLSVSKLKGKGFDAGNVKIDPKNLTMEAPKYNGYGKDGSHYVVRAKEAITDLKQSGPVRLNVIDGEITQTSGVVTKLKSNWGTYDQKKDVLELFERIDVDGSSGMKARLTRATVFPKESRIVSNEPVYVENESGNIQSRQMTFNSKERKGTFTEDVHVRLKANGQSTPGAPPAVDPTAKQRLQSPLPGLAANSGQPIEVRSERLEFDDGTKTALFKQDVIAKQGDAVLQAPELDVFYEGKATMDGGLKAQPKDGTQAEQPQTKLKLIKARGGVVMTNKDDRATGETLDYDAASEVAVLKGNVALKSGAERSATGAEAQFDQKKDTALMLGNVVVTQGKNVMKGQRLFVDRKTGTTRLESPAAAGQPAGRVTTVFYQNESKSQAAAKDPEKAAKEAVVAAVSPFSFKSDPSQPIDIDAETLDVFDPKRQAVFKGNVIAKQGAFVVQTAQMTAFYTGQAGIATGGAPVPSAKGPKGEASQGTQLTRVEARQKVVVTGNEGQRAVGDWANFDVKANTVTMGGNVVVSQGPKGKESVMTGGDGDVFIIDMTSGISRMVKPENPVAKAVPAVSSLPAASGGSEQATKPAPARMKLLLYPKEAHKLSGSHKKLKDARDKAGAPSWDATTNATGKQ